MTKNRPTSTAMEYVIIYHQICVIIVWRCPGMVCSFPFCSLGALKLAHTKSFC